MVVKYLSTKCFPGSNNKNNMPLLKKSFKGNRSQSKNATSKNFKTPLNHKNKIKTLIGETLLNSNSNSTQNAYETFTHTLSQECRSSSPKIDFNENNTGKETVTYNNSKEGRNVKDKSVSLRRKLSLRTDESAAYFQKENREQASGLAKEKNKKKADLVSNTSVCFSQEELNNDETKSAYLEFARKSLAGEERKKMKDKNLKRTFSLSTNESLSQDVLNSSGIKEAYIDFMNKSLANESQKQSHFIVNSSSEDLFNEMVEIGPSTSRKKIKSPIKIVLYKSDDPLDKPIEKLLRDEICKPNSKEQKSRNGTTNRSINADKEGKLYKSRSKENNVSKKPKSDIISEVKPTNSTLQKEKTKKMSKQKLPSQTSTNKKHESGFSKSKSNNSFTLLTEESKFDSDFPHLSPEEKMDKIYEARNIGVYVYCDSCNKARYLPDVVDPLDLPDKWFCYMHPDKKYNKCSRPESVDEDEEFLIHNLYNAGSIVFAKMQGYPWWPAMVEDDPDYEQYFWLEGSMKPTQYHVTFFDSGEVSRAWMKTDKVAPFKKNLNNPEFRMPAKYKSKQRLSVAIKQASEAVNMPLIDRLKTYGFLKRYKNRMKHSTNSKKNTLQNKKQNKVTKKRNKRHASTSSIDDGNISDILGNLNLQDLSFNFLD